MGVENSIEQQHQDLVMPTIPPAPTFRFNKNLLFIIVIIFLVVIAIFYTIKSTQLNKNMVTSSQTATSQQAKWKTYTNNYYNFKLDIPSDWVVSEKIVKDKNYANGEYQEFKLSSPNGDLTIDNTSMLNKNNHVKTQLPNTKVQLGKYIVDRYPYINDNNQRIDYVDLLNVKQQDEVTLIFNGDVEKNNGLLLKILKTFVYTKQNISLDEYISYKVPNGWTKEDTDTSLDLSFTSPDFHEEGLPSIVTGARIAVSKTKKDPEKTLAQQTMPETIYGRWNISTSSATFNSIPFVNIFVCAGEFGFCGDYYSTENNGNVWTITMSCNKDCDTKAGIDSTVYAKDRDTFLSSIRFK